MDQQDYVSPSKHWFLIVAAYSTSKAALLSLHESITAELGLSSPVKTTLVVTGQMYTPLFYGVRTPSTFIAPIVEPLDVAREIIQAIENRQGWRNLRPVVCWIYV